MERHRPPIETGLQTKKERPELISLSATIEKDLSDLLITSSLNSEFIKYIKELAQQGEFEQLEEDIWDLQSICEMQEIRISQDLRRMEGPSARDIEVLRYTTLSKIRKPETDEDIKSRKAMEKQLRKEKMSRKALDYIEKNLVPKWQKMS